MWKDEAYFLDMLTAARKVVAFSHELTRTALDESELHQFALVRAIQIIGEAARHVSDEGKNTHPEIAWKQITGMRHRIVHDYSHIDLDLVWETIQNDIPILITQLEPLIPPNDTDKKV